MLLIASAELIRLLPRHGNIAKQQSSSQEAMREKDCAMFATEGRER